jgi:hypothetical protein
MRAVRLALFAAAFSAGPALAGGLAVPMDEVTLVAFKQPVATMYVGNASIAEVTPIDSKHAFLLGKTFGTTNLIALGADNKIVENEPVTVFGRIGGLVTLNLGADTLTYSCTHLHCETQPEPGDPKTYFDNTQSERESHENYGQKAAIGSAAPVQQQMH